MTKKLKFSSIHKEKSKTSIFFVFVFIFLAVFSLFLIGMLAWGILTSLKNDLNDFKYNVLGLPNIKESFNELVKLSNYTTIFKQFKFKYNVKQSVVDFFGNTVTYTEKGTVNFIGLFINSIIYSVGGAFFLAVIPAITAYLCAKYDFKLSKIIFLVFTIIMCLPIVGTTPAILTFLMKAHIFDNWIGIFLMKASPTGMYFFVFYAFFKTQSDTYREAAEIDGASEAKIMFRIYFPLAKKVIFTVFLIQFVALWNDFQTVNLYMPGLPTIAYGVFQATSTTYSQIDFAFKGAPLSVASSLIAALPVTIIFIIFKDKLMGDISLGGIKE